MSAQEPIRRDPKYRPNHDRSVTISGIIDDTLVSRLLPEIVRLQSVSRDPITVYIDSPGGDIECARLILDALRASDQDRSERCRLITVALGEASSAASDILTAGDYALAYPYSRILCHGTRIRPQSAFTKTQAASYAKYMAGQDEGFAITLARNCIDRFMFRITRIGKETRKIAGLELDQLDKEPPTSGQLAQSICQFLPGKGDFSEELLRALNIAGEKADEARRFTVESGLSKYQLNAGDAERLREKIGAAVLKEAIDLLPLKSISFSDLEPKYLIVCDLFERHHADMLRNLRNRWGPDLLDPQDIKELRTHSLSLSVKVSERCVQMWFLFFFFCRQLQTGDFPMTATEAYWLGLIDEVIGHDLVSPRVLVENAPDAPNEAQGVSQP